MTDKLVRAKPISEWDAAGNGTVTVSLVDKVMRVRCEVDGNYVYDFGDD